MLLVYIFPVFNSTLEAKIFQIAFYFFYNRQQKYNTVTYVVKNTSVIVFEYKHFRIVIFVTKMICSVRAILAIPRSDAPDSKRIVIWLVLKRVIKKHILKKWKFTL